MVFARSTARLPGWLRRGVSCCGGDLIDRSKIVLVRRWAAQLDPVQVAGMDTVATSLNGDGLYNRRRIRPIDAPSSESPRGNHLRSL